MKQKHQKSLSLINQREFLKDFASIIKNKNPFKNNKGSLIQPSIENFKSD